MINFCSLNYCKSIIKILVDTINSIGGIALKKFWVLFVLLVVVGILQACVHDTTTTQS